MDGELRTKFNACVLPQMKTPLRKFKFLSELQVAEAASY